MCGVIGLIYQRSHSGIGRVAAELLKTLEYRGYDSTGAAVQNNGSEVTLLKGVGAPSLLVDQLGISQLAGRVLCGQVRWATFGAVDETNAQPHVMSCKVPFYGAHNGNVTNCDELKLWLESEGHRVRSDNDGEMLVHTLEHYFAAQLSAISPEQRLLSDERRKCMRRALVSAAAKLKGSYAAVVVDPLSHSMWSIKRGSSLYFGFGESEEGGRFTIASSDLSAVLKLTRVLVRVAEGELIEHDATAYQVFALPSPASASGALIGPLQRLPQRSRLQAHDTALLAPYETFMEQEIAAQVETCRSVVTLFLGGTKAVEALKPYISAHPEQLTSEILDCFEQLRSSYADAEIRRNFDDLLVRPAFSRLLAAIPQQIKQRGVKATPALTAQRLVSADAALLTDLISIADDAERIFAVRVLDTLLELQDVTEFHQAVEQLMAGCAAAIDRGRRIYVVCCGSSYHAASAGALFFNHIAGVALDAVLPGEFRGLHANAIADGDVLIAVSQSGETKDLVDILNDVSESGRAVLRVAVVNNVNSTLAQEKAALVIPLRCGAEIAVPATKSFLNQVTVFYCLALMLARYRNRASGATTGGDQSTAELEQRFDKLHRLPDLIADTLASTAADVESAAQSLFLAPSIHVLATRAVAIAKEGALKIREVVLNHSEGFEACEFKHGPNTILGFNTVFGPNQVQALLEQLGQTFDRLIPAAESSGMAADALRRMIRAALDGALSAHPAQLSLDDAEKALLEQCTDRRALTRALYADYPLIFITGPDPRDIRLTVSQINTHKIRGAMTVIIAEDDPDLRQAAIKQPANNPGYHSVYITLPRTDDPLMASFSATVALQRLALRMSRLKQHYLDRLGIANHGVHPDVPKNVSKSITVD